MKKMKKKRFRSKKNKIAENFIPVLRVCCFKNPHHLVGSSAQQDISQVI